MSQAERRLAVVLFNLGGPDSLKAVRPFLFNLFADRAIIRLPTLPRLALATLISTTRAKGAKVNYARMGGRSPLLPETEAQARALQAELDQRLPRTESRVFIAMRYWTPMTGQTAAEVAAFAPDEVVLLPLYPQFSTTTTQSSLDAWRAAYKGAGRVRAVCCYPNQDGLVKAHAERVLEVWRKAGSPWPIRVLFSAHGLPETVVADGDPYQAQIEATAVAVVERLRADIGRDLDWRVCYQSRVGPMKWLGPYTLQSIDEAGAEGMSLLVAPIAFVSEHVETLCELDHDYALAAERAGCPLYLRAPALCVQPSFIDGLAGMVQKALAGPCATLPAGPWRCQDGWRGCPRTKDAE
ncbi:MAG TPA: ferrochelatase [Caulobacteraceae bacterium]|nr:ferrochelatase [Caulobacteraceae bacterium]